MPRNPARVFFVDGQTERFVLPSSRICRNIFSDGPKFIKFTPPLAGDIEMGFCSSVVVNSGSLRVKLANLDVLAVPLQPGAIYKFQVVDPSKFCF